MRLATTANLADINQVGERVLGFYKALAKGGVGTIVTEALRTQPEDPFGPGALVIFDRSAIDSLRALSDICHAEGTLLIGQLNMGGRQHLASRVVPFSIAPSAVACPRSGGVPHQLSCLEIEEIIETINSLNNAKIVIASHQGRVGNKDYTGMEKHAKVLEKLLDRKVTYVGDVMGTAAQNEIKKLNDGEILLLDNLRLCAEENYEFSGSNAAKTIMVKRLSKLLDFCVLDSFPSAHRAHPSIVGFPYVLPSCAGRLVEKEVKKLDEIMDVTKAVSYTHLRAHETLRYLV